MVRIPKHKKDFYLETYSTKNWRKVNVKYYKKISAILDRSHRKEIVQSAKKIWEIANIVEDKKYKKQLLKSFNKLVHLSGAYYEIRKDNNEIEFLDL